VSQDKVRTTAQERIDKPDFDALQTLVYSYTRDMVGGLLGNASGLLSPLAWTKSDDGALFTLALDRLVVCHVETLGTRVEDQAGGGGVAVNVGARWGSVIHSFNPDTVGHDNHPIDYTAARAAEQFAPGTKPYIWVRPFDEPSDVDTRRIWNIATGAEAPEAVATRTRQRMAFKIQTAKPDAGAGAAWCAIAQVWTWVDDKISVIYALSAWDDPDLHALTEEGGVVEDPAAESASFAYPLQRLVEGSVPGGRFDGTVNSWPPGTQRSGGLMYAMHYVRSRLRRHISEGTFDPVGTVTRAWHDMPELSLNGAYKWLTTNTTAIAANLLSITTHKQRNVTLCAGVISFHPALEHPAPNDVAGWAIRHGWGIESVVPQATPDNGVTIRFKDTLVAGRTGWYVSAVSVTAVSSPGHALSADGLVILHPQIRPLSSGDPAADTQSTLAEYAGAVVNLPADQYGLVLTTLKREVVGGVLTAAVPGVGGLTTELAWSVNVVISKYKPGDVGA
jgi:hypothetical protein